MNTKNILLTIFIFKNPGSDVCFYFYFFFIQLIDLEDKVFIKIIIII